MTGPAIPPICGGNDGLHLYMDAGAYYDSSTVFTVQIGESGLDWKILVGLLAVALSLPLFQPSPGGLVKDLFPPGESD